MTGPIDRAFVTIEPDTANFDARARAGVEHGLQGVESTAQEVSRTIERAFQEMTDALISEFRLLGDQLGSSLDSVSSDVRDVGREIATTIDHGVDQAVEDADRLARQFDQAFDKIQRNSRETGSSLKSMIGGLALGGGAVAGVAAIGYGLGQIATFGLTSAASLEQLQTSFNSLLGSATKGQEVFKDLQKFAAETPFEFPDVARASARFLAFDDSVGLTDAQLKKFLTTTGNVIAVTGGGAQALDTVSLAMGQMASSGKITLDNLNQISEALPGFSGVAAIASATGKTTAEVMDLISSGGLDAATGVQALLKGMEQFPGAAGAMAAQSQTLLGVFSTFKDTVGQALAGAFTPVIPAIKDALTQITPVLGDALSVVAPAIGKIIADVLPLIGSLVQAIVPILEPILLMLGPAIAAMGPALAPLGAALGQIASALAPILPPLGQLIGALGTALAPVIEALTPAVVGLVNALLPLVPPLAMIIGQLGGALSSIILPVALALESVFVSLGPPLAQFVTVLANMLAPILAGLGPRFDALITALEPLWPALLQLAPPLIELVVAMTPLIVIAADLLALLTEILAPVLRLAAVFIALLASKALVPFIEQLARTMSLLLSPLEQVTPYIERFTSWIGSLSWSDVGNAIAGGFTSAWNAVVSFFSGLGDSIMSFLTSLPDRLRSLAVQAFDAFFFAIGFGVTKILMFLVNLPEMIASIIVATWNKAQQLFSAGVDAVVSFAWQLPGRIAEAAGNMRDILISIGVNAVTSFVNFMRELPGRTINALSSLASAVRSVVSGIGNWLWNAGSDLMIGFVNGVKSKIQDVINAVTRAMRDTVDGAKRALGIGSPSRVYHEIGQQSMDGYTGGVDSRLIDVKNTMMQALSPDPTVVNNITNVTQGSGGNAGNMTVVVQVGSEQLTGVVTRVLKNNPQDVTTANEQGSASLYIDRNFRIRNGFPNLPIRSCE